MKAQCDEFIDRGSYKKCPLFKGELPDGSFAQIVEIKPSQTVSKHYHEQQYELFYIISGRAKLGIGKEVYEAKPGDIYLVKPKTVHWVENESDEAFVLFVVKLNYFGEDTIWL